MARASIAPRLQVSPIASYDSTSPQSISSPHPMDSPDSGITQIITSKQWVLPPRPKPGRKPSVDTPASKRKAQNRAAQRAFRERRATRVQELEEKLMEVEKEKEVKEMGLVNTIKKLKLENQFLLKNFELLKADFNLFKDKNIQSQPQFKLFSLQNTSTNSPSNQSTGSPASSSYSVQQISPAPSADSPPVYFHQQPYRPSAFTPISIDTTPDKLALTNFDCGVCIKEECLCETVGLKIPQEDLNKKLEQTINSFKPMAAVSLTLGKKRKPNDDVMEIDFTSRFASKLKPMPDLKKLRKSSDSVSESFNESSPVENCGFCSDDTPCVCREAAKEAALLNETLNSHEEEDQKKTLPPIQFNSNIIRKSSLPVMHPGPSVEIREISNLTPGAVPTVVKPTTRRDNSSVPGTPNVMESVESIAPASDAGCTGNPGTCQQCQMDPLSTLFCTTVANKENSDSPGSASSVSTPQPKLPRTGSKSDLPSISVNSLTNPSTPKSGVPPINQGIFIPCADAYKTLSRHKRFSSVDFSTLVGKLTTRGMQVEVQSVANVLRELDRRLYH